MKQNKFASWYNPRYTFLLHGGEVNLFYFTTNKITTGLMEQSDLKYFVYILYSLKDHKFYIGYTGNLEQRLFYHSKGKTKSTKVRRPLRLLFYECYLIKKDAIRREKYFKTTMGKKALKLMLRESLMEINK